MPSNFSKIKTSLVNVFQKILKNIVSLGDDSTLESDLKPLKVGGKNTPIELSENEVKVSGTINAEAINVNGSAVQTGTDAGATDLDGLSDVTKSSGDLTIIDFDTLISDGFIVNSGATIELDAHNGRFVTKYAGTQFSSTNSAYAGMILGYTDIGLDEADATYNLTTSFVVPTDEWGVTFTAPPSGNVEIMTSFQFYAGSTGGGDLSIGLSTANATSGYSALADFHEEVIVDQSGRHNYQLIHKTWTLTGLTAGTSYTYYVGVLSSSTSGTPNIKWGGNGSDKYPDFIMKATALPATITI